MLQTSLSVALIMVDVSMSVLTLLVALRVHVTLDMSWILMEQHVMVRVPLLLILHFLFTLSYADINECSTSNGGCGGTCTNTIGSYHCTCPSGCTLSANGHACNGELYNYSITTLIL